MEQELFDYISAYMVLTEEEKQVIMDLSVFQSCKKGTILLKEGQCTKVGYFVLKGCVRTYYMIDGEEKTTAFYTELEGFEPLCSVNMLPSEYYIACVTDCIIAIADTSTEKEVFERFPRFETLCRIMSEQTLAKSQASFDEFKTTTPEQRYLKLLHTRPDLLERVPQSQLASYLGITPQSLSRIRRRLATQKS